MRYACSTHPLYSAGVSRPVISLRLRIRVLRLRKLSMSPCSGDCRSEAALFLAWAAAREVVGDLVEGGELHPRMPHDVVEQPLEHQQHLRPPGYVGMDGEGEHGVVHLPIDPVELVAPH